MPKQQDLTEELIREINTCIQKLQGVIEARNSSARDLARSAIKVLKNCREKLETIEKTALGQERRKSK